MAISNFIVQQLIKSLKVQNKVDTFLDSYIFKLSNACPDQKILLDLINKRNALVKSLSPLNGYLNNIKTTVTSVDALLKILKLTSTTIQLLPVPLTYAPLSLPNSMSNILTQIDKKLDKNDSLLEAINKVLDIIKKSVQTLLTKLSILDQLIQKCIEVNNIPSGDINLSVFNLDQPLVDNQNSDPISDSYGSFKLEVREIPSNSKYKQRIGVAMDRNGIVLLKTTPSYTSNNKTLLDELKFIIDRDNLKAN